MSAIMFIGISSPLLPAIRVGPVLRTEMTLGFRRVVVRRALAPDRGPAFSFRRSRDGACRSQSSRFLQPGRSGRRFCGVLRGPYCLKASLTFSPASLRSALPWSRSPFACRLLLPVARPASSLTSPVSHWSLLLALSRRLMTFPSLMRLESASHWWWTTRTLVRRGRGCQSQKSCPRWRGCRHVTGSLACGDRFHPGSRHRPACCESCPRGCGCRLASGRRVCGCSVLPRALHRSSCCRRGLVWGGMQRDDH